MPLPPVRRPRGLHDLPQFAPARPRRPVCPDCKRSMVRCPDGRECSWSGLVHAAGGHACPNGTNITSGAELFGRDPGGTSNTATVRR